jgi:hypothetical protein
LYLQRKVQIDKEHQAGENAQNREGAGREGALRVKDMHSPEHVDELRLAFDAGAVRRDSCLREDAHRVDDTIDLPMQRVNLHERPRCRPASAANQRGRHLTNGCVRACVRIYFYKADAE